MAIPRPVAKRQHSSPARYGVTPINLSESVGKLSNGPRSCTNPFLNGSMSIPEDDHPVSIMTTTQVTMQPGADVTFTLIEERPQQQNPFAPKDADRIFFPSNGNEIVDRANKLIDERVVGTNTNGNGTEVDRVAEATTNYMEKYTDLLCVDAFDNLDSVQKQFRNRSLSDTEASESELRSLAKQQAADQTGTTNPFSNNLQKTLSETYLEQVSMNRGRSSSQTWSFGRSIARHGSNQSMTKSNGSQNSLIFDSNEVDLKRAMSCDSVTSESSVNLEDLEQNTPLVTGMLCVGLQYDK